METKVVTLVVCLFWSGLCASGGGTSDARNCSYNQKSLEDIVLKLSTDLNDMQDEVNRLRNKVADHDRRVIFSAYINQEPRLAAYAAAKVVFGGIITNVGSAYDPAAGVFTAPYDGSYMFLVGVDVSNTCFGVDIRKNGHRVAEANNDGYANTHVSTAVALTLRRDDTITVTFYSTRGHVDAGIESMFTGYMLP